MTMEVKVYYRKKIRVKSQQIDHIPKCFQLPRSPSVSKPRTDFYLPICSFKDTELETHSSKEIQSSVTAGCSDTSNDTIKHTVEPESRRRKMVTNGVKVQVTKVKLFGKKAHVQPCNNRNDQDRDDSATTLELTPNRSNLTESCEALHYKKHQRSSKESSGSPDGPDCVNHHDQLHERDNSSSSSRAGTVRSKRERKPKVHFDEVSFPLYTSRKVRRFKIMRSLGLAAPVGSPFFNSS